MGDNPRRKIDCNDCEGDSMPENVAIIIPVYNSEKTIAEVLKSLDAQTRKEMIRQVIVVDDGSTDKSLEMINDIKGKLSLPIEVYPKKNGGVSSARNYGLHKVEDDVQWIAFCDSDDQWYPNKIERQLEVIRLNPHIDCLGGAFINRKLRIGFKIIDELHHGSVKDICISNFPQPSTVIMKKSIFDEMGGFDETQKYAEDGNFFLKVAAKYNLYYLPELLINFGMGKRGFGQSGLSSNLKGMYEGNVKNLKELKDAHLISSLFYYEMRIYHWLKYCRRIVITKLRK